MAGLLPSHAEAHAEMYDGFAAGTITPKGDRLVQETTSIESTVAAVVNAS